MVYELGHLGDRYDNRNNIGVGDPRKEEVFASNLPKKRRRGADNVNKLIGNIAKNYMETTEGKNWAANLISHLNSRFPNSLDTPKNFIQQQQEVQDANLHQIISPHSSLPDLLVSNSFFLPENDVNLRYSCYSPASVNVYNPILCGGSAYNEYIQNVSYGGMNLISPLGVKESDLDIITSPEEVSTITACSYSDMISDTEVFDSITATNSFQQQPLNNGQYISFTGNKRSAYKMDHPLLSVDDVQSPYLNPCNVQQSFQNLPEPSDSLLLGSNNQDSFQPQIQGQQHFDLESSSDVFTFKVLSAYVIYKDMPADLRKEVSFQDYMHAAECQDNLCKCHMYLELSSHFDKCTDSNCNICGPARCGSTGNFQLESRKRKYDQSEATDSVGPTSTGTLLDVLLTKYPKLESSTVGEDAMDDEPRRKVNGDGQQELTVINQSDNNVTHEMMKSPQLCSHNLSSKETTIDAEEKSGQATIEANKDLNSGADAADSNSVADVAGLNSSADVAGLNSSADVADLNSSADVAELNSNNSMAPNVSMADCDSALESDNTKLKVGSLTDNDAQLEPEKIKIQSVSLADFFTADQIKEHLSSFTSQKVVSENRAPSIGPNTCQLCSMDKLVFAPAPIYCSSCDTRIKRNVGYYRSTNGIGTRHCFCMSCYRGSHGNNILIRGYGYSIPKSYLQKAKNDEEREDSWVLCDKCQCWQHRICGLYNDEKDVEGKAEYICPKCYLEEIESGIRVPLPQTTASAAKDLPRTNLSDHIEQRLSKRLEQERQEMAKVSGIEASEVPGAEDLVVRVVVSVQKQLEVRQKFIDILHGECYPSGFTYRSKLIFLFQKIEGVDVCLFGMCVQEFGSECGGPNKRCVYISYLDSVKYFRPERKCVTGESLRTFVYHEILTGYLEYCKKRGFATCYIWACPLIKGEDYIFYCHPETQRTPKQDKLRQWYKSMLKKATEDNVVVDHTNLYNQFFVPSGEGNTKITAARLPYFDGDYWSGAAENIIKKLEVEESAGGLQSKLPNKRILKAMGQDKTDIAVKDVLVMQKLGQTILPVKENFMIVHLQYVCTHCHEVILSGSRWFCSHCKKIQLCSRCLNADKNICESKLHTCPSGEKNKLLEVLVNDVTLDTKDTDDVFVNSFFETRDAFLNKCQKSHFQFDTLSRAKYSSMMILYHLIYKPVNKPTCTACHTDVLVELSWYCDICAKYYICESCYIMRQGAHHPHRLNPPSMDFDCGSKSQQLQMQKDRLVGIQFDRIKKMKIYSTTCANMFSYIMMQLKFVLDTLMHASECERIPCAYNECNTMRRLFYHAARCSIKARGGCKFCQRVWTILKLHSQICTDSDCKIPRCMDIKKHKEMLAARPAYQQVAMNYQQEVAAEAPVG
ncbi:hypothetical protein SSX86_030344 [Deinandra increscens subsp. villosa]|uniref:histone acetyltransferase n=1 Tax=Deinandra increscens subsp. villosa TaxID=3103831 RepID=A0AAP0GIC5_9ASTR